MTDKASSGGISFGGALFLVFLTLKLTGYITWSWWWVTSPLWIPFIILMVLMGVTFIYLAVKEVYR